MLPTLHRAAALLAGLLSATPLLAQTRENPIRIEVDGREFPRHILHSTLTLPVAAGPLTLYYPKWVPGEHRASGPIADLTGIFMRANGEALPWVRDTLDYYTFHCTVPRGATALEVTLDLIEAPSSHELGALRWQEVVLYPAGQDVSALFYSPFLRSRWSCC